MTRTYRFVVVIAVLALVGGFAVSAVAQVIAKDAQFTLPFKANWEGKVLPPGDYKLTVAMVSGGKNLIYRVEFAGAGVKETILAVNRPGPVAKQSMILVESQGMMFNVRELHLAKADVVLTFPGAKPEDNSVAQNRNAVPVPIQIALK